MRSDYLPFGRPNFSDAEIEAVTRVMRSGWIGMGAETVAFEQELAAFVGARQVVAVNSCTSALFLSLLVHGVGPGDEVICPSLTWCSTANAALYLGATPVFCDVDPGTLNVTAATVRAALTERTKAVMVVHFGGLAADVAAIRDAIPSGVAIIEDAAHALGARHADGSQVGSSRNLACFSFYANKNLATGDGGALAVADAELAARLQILSRQGLGSDAWKRFIQPQVALLPGIAELGYKMNYIDLLAGIGRVQLRRQPEFAALRLAIARRYAERLEAWGGAIGIQEGLLEERHARHLFVLTLPVERMRLTRDELVLALRARNVGASIHYAPLHTMPLYAARPAALPATDRLRGRIMTLPISASMSLQDADYVLDQLAQLLELPAGSL